MLGAANAAGRPPRNLTESACESIRERQNRSQKYPVVPFSRDKGDLPHFGVSERRRWAVLGDRSRQPNAAEESTVSAADDFQKRLEADLARLRNRGPMPAPPAADPGPSLPNLDDSFHLRLQSAIQKPGKSGKSGIIAGAAGNGGDSARRAPVAQPTAGDEKREYPPDLGTVIDAWPTLSPAVRASILAMVRAGRGPSV